MVHLFVASGCLESAEVWRHRAFVNMRLDFYLWSKNTEWQTTRCQFNEFSYNCKLQYKSHFTNLKTLPKFFMKLLALYLKNFKPRANLFACKNKKRKYLTSLQSFYWSCVSLTIINFIGYNRIIYLKLKLKFYCFELLPKPG